MSSSCKFSQFNECCHTIRTIPCMGREQDKEYCPLWQKGVIVIKERCRSFEKE